MVDRLGLVSVRHSSLTDLLLHASLLCGLVPGGPAAHRYQLFFVAHHRLGVQNRTNDLQRALETGVDDKLYWENDNHGSGNYRVTALGHERATTRLGVLEAAYPPSVGPDCLFEFSGEVEQSRIHGVCRAGTFEIQRDGVKTPATHVLRWLKKTLGTPIPFDRGGASRALYDYATHAKWTMRWLGPERDRPFNVPSRYGDDLDAAILDVESRGDFDPTDLSNAQIRTLRSIVARRGQPRFRAELIRAYGGRCAISRCSCDDVLEAAHIIPYGGDTTNHVRNGLLLRADLHTLFDRGRIAINAETWQIVISERLRHTEYAALAGQALHLPEREQDRPHAEAISWHRRESGLLFPRLAPPMLRRQARTAEKPFLEGGVHLPRKGWRKAWAPTPRNKQRTPPTTARRDTTPRTATASPTEQASLRCERPKVVAKPGSGAMPSAVADRRAGVGLLHAGLPRLARPW